LVLELDGNISILLYIFESAGHLVTEMYNFFFILAGLTAGVARMVGFSELLDP